ncbi:hypothetical protein Hypma_004398 [Hypsizygus marmoreus]|uniref:Uncharacterized protein n=1 Tax=Hypsizygus marmoreus TaxID=39966 RepID=A0A369K3T9_HYPMA|nr:hypothetical protein Hypma_004398 [Hypsizygus marmoreus]
MSDQDVYSYTDAACDRMRSRGCWVRVPRSTLSVSLPKPHATGTERAHIDYPAAAIDAITNRDAVMQLMHLERQRVSLILSIENEQALWEKALAGIFAAMMDYALAISGGEEDET